jgi:hypothetical protein
LLSAYRRLGRIWCIERESDVNAEHTEKAHPIAGYISAVVLSALVLLLMGALNTNDKALIGIPFVAGWAIVSLYLFTKRDSDDHA